MKKVKTLMISWLTINRCFKYEGRLEDLSEKMSTLSGNKWKNGFFYSKKIKEDYYQIFATFSLGTLIFSGGGGSSIKIHMKINEINDSEQKIKIWTKIRPENWFILFMFILMSIGFITVSESYLEILFLFALFFICFVWFNFIYKIQERILIEKTVNKLDLQEEITSCPEFIVPNV